ncbi:hypothetical protein SDRG_04751 [Saprolegnia diclina VS20]|uniref:FHA domain-containing protein n=1 Tax=Saprolegnia diclina (strain VS20) TaxID=1156394 RepID=T0QI93_SAPDV|nr:hypothetical protein SDRG_04751 [Saprolegnia diclina VS20]EQC37724.1 hypothetical protein SDRG_04751 [Saprolegnia diclina VS20]|eukprot:XP_008608657.1 hypothetical protein SDRG_04751 [Saprolegnia diclina VS20]
MSSSSSKPSDRRWSFVRASEFFSGDGKPDTLDIRGMTAAAKGVSSKRQKFRMSVVKNGVTIYGSKPCPNAEHDLGHGLLGQPAPATGASTPLKDRERIFIEDPRAPCLTIDYGNDTYKMMPSIERFSAHTGVCQILGTKLIRGGKHQVHVGDILRFGSVGLLVTEIDTGRTGTSDASLSPSDISHLTQRLVCLDEHQGDVDSGDDTDEANGNEGSQCDDPTATRLSNRSSSVAICYVCYDESEDDNPLIAPCKCSGDTKYIHLNCLKRWHTNGDKNEICAVLDESDARTCSICKAAYPSRVKIPETGTYVSLLPDRLDAPSIMLQVVTKHSSSTLNTSTRYQLSYKTLLGLEGSRPLMIGRSSQCDLVLKYRTVSTIHAELHYSKGEWFVKDAGSSNGTLRYIYRPLTLANNQMLHVKFGRTVLSIKPTKKLRLPSLFGIGKHESSQLIREDDNDERSHHRHMDESSRARSVQGRALSADAVDGANRRPGGSMNAMTEVARRLDHLDINSRQS